VRSLASLILKNQGFTVLEAKDPHAALDLQEQHTGPIHLLLTDMVLPQLSGRELAERILHNRPQAKVLFLSGYLEGPGTPKAVTGAAFLSKPFSPDGLVSKVTEVLARS
jgi:CheY-like chemotaxis protein